MFQIKLDAITLQMCTHCTIEIEHNYLSVQFCPYRLAVVIAYCTLQSHTELWVFRTYKRFEDRGILGKAPISHFQLSKAGPFQKSLIGECWWAAWKQFMCIWFILPISLLLHVVIISCITDSKVFFMHLAFCFAYAISTTVWNVFY